MSVTVGFVVATAYANQPTATKVPVDAVTAVSTIINYGVVGRSLAPVEAVAQSVTAPVPVRPTVVGEQLQFFWG